MPDRPLYKIDKQSDTPLYMQIKSSIEDAISEGVLKPGDKLPPVTALAKEIGVTQATVRRALQDLGEAGHTCCHVGRGTFIKDAAASASEETVAGGSYEEGEGGCSKEPTPNAFSLPPASRAHEFAARRLRMGVSGALRDIISLADRPGIIDMSRGVPDPASIPQFFLEEVADETFTGGAGRFAASTDPIGMYDLRKEIADRFTRNCTPVTPDQVLITNGSIQAITLISQSIMESGEQVICETPCFKGITDTFAAMGHWVETVTRDKHGPVTELLSRISGCNPSLLYMCQYAHNPVGTNLGTERCKGISDWAARTGSTVVADEIFRDLSYEEPNQPGIMKFLGADRTVVVSSLSKSLMTGLRLGWMISSHERIRRIAQLKKLMDQATPSIIQGMALTILRSGRFDEHVAKMRAIYKKRMGIMLRALQKYMPDQVSWSTPDGGFSLILELPEGYSSVALFLSAVERGVSFLPGPLFDIDQRFLNCCRISVAWIDEDEIVEGVQILAGAVDDILKKSPGDAALRRLGGYQ